jgi:hypothetical protein
MRLIKLALKRLVIGPPIAVDARLSLGKRDLAGIDRLAIGHHTRDDPETRGDARIVALTADTFDQGRVKLVCAAVEIDEGARRTGPEKRCARARGAVKQLIDKGILRRADRMFIERRAPQEGPRILPPAMRRGEHHRCGAPFGMGQVIGGLRHRARSLIAIIELNHRAESP